MERRSMKRNHGAHEGEKRKFDNSLEDNKRPRRGPKACKKDKSKERHLGYKESEANALRNLISSRKLVEVSIPADGNCVFSAVSELLDCALTPDELRHDAVQYMRDHKEYFMPFISECYDGDTSKYFVKYCDQMESSLVWGGQLEAEGAPVVMGEEFPGAVLHLVYYKHRYRAGEHYNCLKPE